MMVLVSSKRKADAVNSGTTKTLLVVFKVSWMGIYMISNEKTHLNAPWTGICTV